MDISSHSVTMPERREAGIPWLVFLFLAAVFFCVYHNLAPSKEGFDNYYPTQALLVSTVADGSVMRRVALLALGLFAIVSLFRSRSQGRPHIRGSLGWLVVFFVGWAVISLIWADDMALTATRISVFVILCVAAVALGRRFSLRELVLWTFFTCGIYVVIGVLVEVWFGAFRPFGAGYRFAGTLNPNSQGINCALLLLSAVAAAHLEKRRRTLFRIGAVVGFVFLALTASRTAFASTLLTLAAYYGAICSKKAKIVAAYALSIVLCILALSLGNALLPDLESAVMLGRVDGTAGSFNGRTGVWDEVSSYVGQRPILGYGYDGFWTPTHISDISTDEKWGVPNSHSAYLDYLLCLGAVGLLAYVLLLFTGIQSAFRFYRLSRNSIFLFCGALLVFCAFEGLLESTIAEPSLPMFVTAVVLFQLAFFRGARPYRTNEA